MKPIQIGLLVVVGAVGGALVMKVTQRPAPVPEVAQASAPPAPAVPVQPAPPATPAEAPMALEPAKPLPMEAPKPRRVTRASRPADTVKVEAMKPEPPPRPAEPEPVKEAVAPPLPPPAPSPAPEPVVSTPPPPPVRELHTVTLNAGMLLPVRLVDGLSSERNFPGDTFIGTLDKELVVDGFVIAERGSRVEGRVVAADRGGKVKGVAAIAVELTRLRTADGQNLSIRSDSFERHAEETHKEDAAKVGGGAALGAIIGAIAGGGKGAAVGAAAGGAAGAGTVLATRGKEVRLPSETRINFRLSAPVTVTERR